MKHNRLQNKVAGSVFTLPVCAVIATALWWLPQRTFSVRHILGLALCLLITYVIMETNARQHIIRIRTRMISCVWIVLATCLSFMHPLGEPIIAAAFLCIGYTELFRCYQQSWAQANVFHAFLMLGLDSFCTPVTLLMAVPFYLYLAILLRSLTWKTFWAGILGLIAPYWFYAFWCFMTKDMQSFVERITDMTQFELPSLEAIVSLPFVWQVSAAVIALLSIVSILHYLRTRYDDKIRVRMIIYIYVAQTLLLMVFLILQPAHYETTMALLVVSASPLIAHYFALTSSILSSIFFVLSLLLTAAMGVLNLWMPTFSIS